MMMQPVRSGSQLDLGFIGPISPDELGGNIADSVLPEHDSSEMSSSAVPDCVFTLRSIRAISSGSQRTSSPRLLL